MIVNNRNLVRIAIFPLKADAPLIIDPNTVLSSAIALELLQSIAGRGSEIFERFSSIHDDQFPEHGPLQFRRVSPHRLAEKQAFCVPVTEALDHSMKLALGERNVKRYYWRKLTLILRSSYPQSRR